MGAIKPTDDLEFAASPGNGLLEDQVGPCIGLTSGHKDLRSIILEDGLDLAGESRKVARKAQVRTPGKLVCSEC